MALNEIYELRGKQFDPTIAEIAMPVLKQCGILPAIAQMPTNELENARFAYFFKDPLTGAYSYQYLTHILQRAQEYETERYHCCHLVGVGYFNHYNKQYGWTKGDKKLIEIAEELMRTFPESLIFRVYGDDFLILSKEHVGVKKECIRSFKSLQNTHLTINVFHKDLHEQYEDLHSLVAQVEYFIQSSTQ